MQESDEHKVFKLFARELRDLVWGIQEYRTGQETKQEILTLYLSVCDHLIDQITQQKRAIAVMRGEKVEPMTHYAKAVVTGIMGAGP